MPGAGASIEVSASESRVRRDTGAASGAGILPSFRSISAPGAAPVCAGVLAPAGVIEPCHEGAAAELSAGAEAPACVSPMAASLAEAAAAAPAGAGAAAMAAKD